MDWYNRLNDYFPKEEMKKYSHLRDLIQDQDMYHKEETEDYLLLYGEFSSFVFVDYLLVNQKRRGSGVGSKVIRNLKEKRKPILLEVEPADPQVADTQKRIHFYRKNGFQVADQIHYEREADNGETFSLNIHYWTPKPVPQAKIYHMMSKACHHIHNFRSEQHYGRIQADPDEVLELKQPVLS
ncbi:GNAT family N-acetyltransferase [Melghirimyces algeriensis]|uniref:Acetyltransferase (GNAT) domain-containing protein n=1 Tax=Melghirimyces algeriensis TaxID=910412 RepID=A0A521F884_9BACL|nr:GNAT family N-acetyltransferase [Melghirimyces algeriensis]SMO92336.1 Acetyltransferase (GNAT) domain-containing protein [Melghirimyces algeriensis]